MLANPSCWPKTAIVATGVIIYGLIISLYFLCYVPVILGSPIVMIAKGVGYPMGNYSTRNRTNMFSSDVNKKLSISTETKTTSNQFMDFHTNNNGSLQYTKSYLLSRGGRVFP
uniref:Transmembrane protein n=1 Tax=Heterorhabditis bacteriophora TaxID=37862 RepID=A0A1I7WUH1_HETBA